MREQHKKILSLVIIIILLPYILTVFIKGEGAFPVQSSLLNTQVQVESQSTVISITWEEYLVGLLAKEIPETYSLEAMKSQSVIIQTRLAKENDLDSSEDYIFTDDFYTIDDIQIKWEYNSVEIYNQLIEAVTATSNTTLWYESELASVPYHMLNTGTTRNGNEVFYSEDYPYLLSVSCPLDLVAEDEISIFTISYEDLAITLEDSLELAFESDISYDDISNITRDDAGYVISFELQGNVISGELFRTTLGLKSSAFSFQNYDDSLQITTEGVGHGLGLSQNTAHYMGLEGKSYEEILTYFYPGTELVQE